MTTPWKAGDYLEMSGQKLKILGVCGEIVFTSTSYDHEEFGMENTRKHIEKLGYTLVTPPEEWPKRNDVYYTVDSDLCVLEMIWANEPHDGTRWSWGNVHRSREAAEAWVEKVKKISK